MMLGLMFAGDAGAVEAPVGRQIEEFTLKDYLGAGHSLSDWKDKKALVVVFVGTECPLVAKYGSTLSELAANYKERGVQFVAIDSNQQDSLAEISHFARTYNLEFPILKDPENRVADKFGAERTPEAFVLDASCVLRYRGRIDDQFGINHVRPSASRDDLSDALDAVLADKEVKSPHVAAVGCRIGRVNRTEPRGDITYSNQVSRILQNRCVTCHREGQIAPFALSTYRDAVDWSETVREVIQEGRMPPWHASPEHGSFVNETQMPQDEKRVVLEWIENGMPEGDASQLQPPREFAEGWRIPTPDLVVKMPKPFTVPASGVVEYKYFTVDPGFKEDMWIRAAEGKPGNRGVMHHLILFYLPPGQKHPQPQDALFNSIGSFAPGMPALIAPDGMGRRVPAGSRLMFQMHYTPNGTEQVDQSEVGLVFADPKTIKRELTVGAAFNWKFRIPAGADNYRVEAGREFGQDTFIYALVPHMHLRGKAFRYTAKYPDGNSEILLDVPRYDFNWQNVYQLTEPKIMPAGTKLQCVAHYDNSENNLSNPNPRQSVHWGDQTWEEMMVGSFYFGPAEQDLTLGPPQVRQLGDNKYEATFRYKPPTGAQRVYLAGKFNEWKPDGYKMAGPDKDGFYMTSIELGPGRHEYKFVIDGKTWKADPGNREQTGYFGNSLLVLGKN
jgi:peroxiredoxin